MKKKKKSSFTQFEIIGTAPNFRTALKSATGVALLTFPSIFIKGKFVGGGDDLAELVSKGEFARLIATPATQFLPGRDGWGEELKANDVILWLKPPRNGRWYCFQLHTYANHVRGISLLHVCIFGALLGLEFSITDKNQPPIATLILMYYLLFDLGLYVLFGPVPWSPLGCLVNASLWSVRDNSVTVIPYKLVFGYYVFGIASALWSKTPQTHSSMVSLWTGFLINSSLLAVLRF